MKMKTKLPLIFLLTFILILLLTFGYLKTIIGDDISMQLLSRIHVGLFLSLLVLTGITFVVLSVYFHFNITIPIQVLNTRLKSIHMEHSQTSGYSKRKDEIGDLYKHFNDMEKRLTQAHKEQIDMIAAMAHDLKTPLTTINGFVELLAMQENLSEKEKQEYYELILKKSKHMTELINNFSTFTRAELELNAIDMKQVEALKLFDNIAAEYEIELSVLDYQLEWKNSFSPKHILMINEHMIRRVFGNLFSNAVKYSERKDLKVYMSANIQAQYACFQIEDNGSGVPEEDLSFLFLKFFTVDKARQSKNGGTGLGLASCKSIIEHHGGEISAFKSDYGGLGIRFTLPLVS